MPRPEEPFEPLALYLKGLSNARRLLILHMLTKPQNVEAVAKRLEISRQAAQEHLDQLVELELIEQVKGRGEQRVASNYIISPQRLFGVYESFGKLGDLERELEERVTTRAPTMADAGLAAPKVREEELPRLTIVHGMRVGETTVLEGQGPWSLGRDLAATVSLDYDPYASTRHAEVRRAAAAGFQLADLYSSNGTFLDWKPLERGATAKLENGGLVRVGKTLLLFRR